MTSRPRRPSTVAFRLRPVALAVALVAVGPHVQALPVGAQTVAGQATVQSPAAGQLLIQQGSDKAIVDWKSFSIATGERVLISQPGSQSVLLNRVVGGDPSLILGQLQANGSVFLVNPRGIVFGRGSQVDAGSFVASTLDLRNDDFLAGRYSLAAGSTAPGSLRADGDISAPDGTVALVAPVLSVGGNVTAQRIGLAAAGSVRIDVEGDGLVLFNVRNEGLDSRLDLLGRLQAEGGGSVEVRAQARAGFADTVLNMDGVVQARSLGSRGGRIVIDGGTAGGTRVAGTLDATGAQAGEQGGSVTVLGAQLALTDTAVVDVSGRSGGGTALIGGGLHGTGTAHDAVDTRVAAGAVVRADALDAGNGGTVAVWSDRSTVFDGRISARGGAAGGDGGFAEVSGRRQLDFTGTVDLRPANAGAGRKGTLLLDPLDLVIGNTADIAGDGSNLDLTTPVVVAGDNPGATSRITATQVVAQLDGANVRLEATRDITVQTAIDASSNTGSGSLSLFAGNDIALLAGVTTRGSDVVLGANHDFGGGNPASGFGTVSLANGVQVSTRGGGLTGGNIGVSGAAVTLGTNASLVAGADITVTGSASALALGALTAGGKIVVQAGGGGITQTGAVSVGADGSSFTATGPAQSIDLTNAANAFNGKTVALHSTGDASIAADSLVLAASTVGGRLTATATTGGISQTGALNVGADGSSFATTGTAQSIDLTNGANVFNGKTVALQSTGDASITADALVLAASGVAGRLAAIATTGGISQTGALAVGADGNSFATTGSLQSIDLTSANVFNGKTVALQSTGNASISGDSLVLATSTIGGRLTATATSGGISQTGALTVGADGSSFATTGSLQSIDLTRANVFNGKTVALQSTGNAAISGDALVLAASTVGGRLTAVATSGGLSQSGALTVGADGSSFATTGSLQSIDLTNVNVFNGKTVALQSTGNASISADSLVLATSTVGGRLTASATSGGISQTGALTVGADGSSFATTGASRSIDLTGANVFNGKTVALQSAGDASITADALVLATSGVGGRLIATATAGGISQTGALTLGADGSRFTTSAANQAIALGNPANAFNGKTVGLQTTGANGNATLRGDALTLAASNVGGQLSATSTGPVTQTGALVVGGATLLTAAGTAPVAITLDNAGNDFGGNVQLTTAGAGSAVGNAVIVAQNSLSAGGTAGSLQATAGGALTLSGGTFAQLAARAQSGIAQSAPLTVTGATTLTGAPGMSIDLASQGAGNLLQTVQLASSGAGSLGTVRIANAGSLNVGGDASLLQVTASGALTLGGGRYTTLALDTSAANGAVGQTGALQVGGTSTVAAGSGAVTFGNAGNDFGVVSITSAGSARVVDANDLTIGASQVAGRFELDAPGALQLTGPLTGTGSLALTGAGTLLVDSAHPYTGGTVVQAGTLTLDGGTAQAGVSGPISVAAGARLDLRNGATIANPVTSLGGTLANSNGSGMLTGAITLQAATTVDVAQTAAGLTLAGPIGDAGTGSGLTKTGGGALTLSAANGYTGATLINAGTLFAGGAGSGATFAAASPIVVAAGATLALLQDQTLGTLAGAGNVALGGHDLTLGAGAAAGSLTVFSGVIGGLGGLAKVGDGTQVLAGADLFTGGTTVSAGTLQVAGGQALADVGAVSVAAGARLALADDETIGALSGAGTVDLGARRLTTGTGGASAAFAGSLVGSGGLTKVDGGTLSLTGNNLFTGDLVVGAGSLVLGSPTALAAAPAVSVAAGATVALGADVRIGSLSGAGRVALQGQALDTGANGRDTAFVGTLDGAGSLTKSGSGTFTLGGSNLYTGSTTVAGGVLNLTAALPAATALGIAAGATVGLGTELVVGSLSGAGTLALGTHSATVGATNADSRFDGTIGGTGNLVKQGTGTLVLAGTNTYTGNTQVQGGTLAVGLVGGTGGTLGTGAVTNDATLRLQRSDATRVDNAIGGSGSLVVADGSVTLTNPGNGYTGATLVQGGTLATAGADILPSATTVQVNAGAQLVLGGKQTLASLAADGNVTVTGDVSTAGDQHYGGVLTVQATAGVRFSAARLDALGAQNQFGSQPISITAGTVQLAAAQALVLGDLQIGQGGQITAPKIDLVGNLALAQGVLGLTATAAPDPAAAVTDPTARVPGTRTPLAIAGTTLAQGTSSTVTVAAGAELDLAATGGGSVQFAQDANSFLGALSVLSGPAFNTAWSPNVQGSVAIQSQVRVAGGTVNVGGAGIEADTVSIRADQLSTAGTAKLTARLPFDDVNLGTVASLPSMLLDLSPTAFLTTASFGTSMVGIQVEIGSRLTGNRIDGPDAGYLTVRPKNGAQGMTAVFLSGPNSSATVGGYRFFQDGAGNQSEIPVFYNNLLPQTPQVSGALSSVAAVAEAARKERFEETVRTENVAVRLRSGVIAEVGPGRPATVGTEGVRPPESCPPNRPDALTCN